GAEVKDPVMAIWRQNRVGSVCICFGDTGVKVCGFSKIGPSSCMVVSHGWNSSNGRDQRNRGQQSNRSTNSGNSLHLGECRRVVGTCFKCGQAGHLQKDCKKNTTASTSGLCVLAGFGTGFV
nr:hypothetical protein [Tanacetum cinerariifolium]